MNMRVLLQKGTAEQVNTIRMLFVRTISFVMLAFHLSPPPMLHMQFSAASTSVQMSAKGSSQYFNLVNANINHQPPLKDSNTTTTKTTTQLPNKQRNEMSRCSVISSVEIHLAVESHEVRPPTKHVHR